MNVAVDQARHDPLAVDVDDLHAGRQRHLVRRADGFDPIAFHHHDGVPHDGRRAIAVGMDHGGTDEGLRPRGLGRRRSGDGEARKQDQADDAR